MKSYEGYLKLKLGDSHVLLAGGSHKSLSDFLGSISWDATNKKILYKASNASSWSDLLLFGSNAFNSTGYLPLSGGTLTGTLTISGAAIECASERYKDSSGYALNLNNSDIVGVNGIFTADLSDSWKESIGFARTDSNYDTIRASDGKLYFGIKSGTNEYEILHLGNYATNLDTRYVKKSGDTMTGPLIFDWQDSTDVSSSTSNPRILFKYTASGSPLTVGLVFTRYDSVLNINGSKGLVLLDMGDDDTWAYFMAPHIVMLGSSNSYVLLGGGSHKAESLLSVAEAYTVSSWAQSSGNEYRYVWHSWSDNTSKLAYNSGIMFNPNSGMLKVHRIYIDTDNDAEASSNSSGSLIIGNTSGQHLALDDNEIISANNTSAGRLHLQYDGGLLQIGGGSNVTTNLYGTFYMENGPIYTHGDRYGCIQGSNSGIGGIHLNNSDITGVNSILTSDLSEDWTESLAFRRSNGNYDTFRGSDGTFYFQINNGTEICRIGSNYIYVSGATNSTMSYNTGNPRIIFSENGSQAVGLVYCDYDAYRPSKGIKCMDVDGDDPGNVWFEAQGSMYASNFYTSSDRNKKQNISSFSEHIRKFQFKDTEKWHYGVIALEVEEMFRDGEEGNMTVNYNSILSYYVGLLENKVKELEEKIKLLETKQQ